MQTWKKWLFGVAWLAAALIAGSSVVQAVRQGSWSPLISVSWLAVVIAVTLPGASRRCVPHRRNGSANHPAG